LKVFLAFVSEIGGFDWEFRRIFWASWLDAYSARSTHSVNFLMRMLKLTAD